MSGGIGFLLWLMSICMIVGGAGITMAAAMVDRREITRVQKVFFLLLGPALFVTGCWIIGAVLR